MVPSGTEAARAFIPAKDFDSSKAFYEALGFKKLLDGDVAILAWAQALRSLVVGFDSTSPLPGWPVAMICAVLAVV